MNEIMMNQKVSKWNEACRFLKGKQSELSVEEWTAVELLADFWRERSFDEDSVAECEGLIATLSACDKLHIANLDIITWSKEFRGIAKAMYTKDKETFEQFREAMKKFNRANRPQSSRPAPERPSSPSPAPVNNILLKQPEVVPLPTGTFYAWLKQKGKLGGQHKVPRLSNSREYADEILKIKSMEDSL